MALLITKVHLAEEEADCDWCPVRILRGMEKMTDTKDGGVYCCLTCAENGMDLAEHVAQRLKEDGSDVKARI